MIHRPVAAVYTFDQVCCVCSQLGTSLHMLSDTGHDSTDIRAIWGVYTQCPASVSFRIPVVLCDTGTATPQTLVDWSLFCMFSQKEKDVIDIKLSMLLFHMNAFLLQCMYYYLCHVCVL